ncbi:unnamed protein product [Cylicocyclus nassatus]|uniref:Uncharacterized protein n=1 Tax=Cylicocyclus nassatus TaxID=53992 RepID=A0AA36HF18_CYLNA|nr:unnamed protein product [Cylicocyclus nassatus]
MCAAESKIAGDITGAEIEGFLYGNVQKILIAKISFDLSRKKAPTLRKNTASFGMEIIAYQNAQVSRQRPMRR